MKNKRVITVVSVFWLCFSLNACQLARPDAGKSGQDALIGAYITYEPLDLFDAEGLLESKQPSLTGDNIFLDDSSGHANRIYATLKPKTGLTRPALIKNNSGEDKPNGPTKEYGFEGLEGIPFFAAQVQTEDPLDTYQEIITSEAMQDVDFKVFISGEENKTELEGRVYVQTNNKEVSLFIHPVYQTEEGKVYLIGENKAFTGHFGGEGEILTHKLESSVKSNFNGIIKKRTSSVKISLNGKVSSDSVFLLQLNQSNQIIKKDLLNLISLPKELRLEKDTAYLIQEIHGAAEDGTVLIQRRLVEYPAAAFSTFRLADKGILIRHDTTLIWP